MPLSYPCALARHCSFAPVWFAHFHEINACTLFVAGRPLVICPEGQKPDVGDGKFDTIEVPQIVDCLQCVLSIVPLQLLSFHIVSGSFMGV